jgi:urease accessory protein
MTVSAAAHTGQSNFGGLAAGFLHPLTGPDHIVAMVAVGLWGAFLSAPAIWALPILFPMVMAFGGAWGMLGFPLAYAEMGVAASGLVLGLMVLFGVEAPL